MVGTCATPFSNTKILFSVNPEVIEKFVVLPSPVYVLVLNVCPTAPPRILTLIFAFASGASVNVNVLPLIEYALVNCETPSILTMVYAADTGVAVNGKLILEPLATNVFNTADNVVLYAPAVVESIPKYLTSILDPIGYCVVVVNVVPDTVLSVVGICIKPSFITRIFFGSETLLDNV